MAEVTESIRMGLALVMLAIASVSDLRTRRVRNHTWFPFIGFAAVFVLMDLATMPWRALVLPYGLALGFTALWYGVWYLGVFGGADAKGLMVLSWLLPHPLDPSVPLPAVMDALVNGAFIVLAYPVVFLAFNLGRGRIRLPAMILGTPLPIDEAQRRKVWPMQRATLDGIRWKYWQHIGVPMDDVYRDLRRAGVSEVWTTPKIPLIVPIAVGLALTAAYGNLWLALVAQWMQP